MLFYYTKRFIQEIPFTSKSTGLGAATAFTTLMLIITSTASAQGSRNDPTFFSVKTNKLPITTTEVDRKEGIIPSLYPAKAQIVVAEEKSKETVEKYVAKKGETVSSIAKKHGVSPDTIRWANNIWGDQVTEGAKLKILPVSGFEYVIQKGDSVRSIAKTYKAHAATIVTFNEIEPDALKNGQTIIIPGGSKPLPKKPIYRFSAGTASDPSGYNTVTPALSNTPTYSGNGYPWGNCTWYVSNRRAELGRPVPNKLGNAGSWAYSASSRGFTVNKVPSIGAVMVESGKGHVAVVESINADGSVTISEMNFNWRLGVKSNRTIPAASVGRHSYIH